jgi:site-specific DNA-cytosine methylase
MIDSTTIAPLKNSVEKLIVLYLKTAYGVAWQVLDAQYFGVPQHHRRLGDRQKRKETPNFHFLVKFIPVLFD